MTIKLWLLACVYLASATAAAWAASDGWSTIQVTGQLACLLASMLTLAFTKAAIDSDDRHSRILWAKECAWAVGFFCLGAWPALFAIPLYASVPFWPQRR